jgi:uncharacterized coiled-coil DUF342 family protein
MKTQVIPTSATFNSEDFKQLIDTISDLETKLEAANQSLELNTNKFMHLIEGLAEQFTIKQQADFNQKVEIYIGSRGMSDKPEMVIRPKTR